MGHHLHADGMGCFCRGHMFKLDQEKKKESEICYLIIEKKLDEYLCCSIKADPGFFSVGGWSQNELFNIFGIMCTKSKFQGKT